MDKERKVASPPQSPTSIFLKSYPKGYGKRRGRHEDEATTIVHQALDDLAGKRGLNGRQWTRKILTLTIQHEYGTSTPQSVINALLMGTAHAFQPGTRHVYE